MNKVAVSVILPIYNAEKYLEQCLDSIVHQTLQNIEIICVDDGSNDNSIKIVKQFIQKDKRITLITQTNKGAGTARNEGLKIAKGDYLSFLDADDFFEITMLEKAYKKAKNNGSDIVVWRCNKYFDQTKTYEDYPQTINIKFLPQKETFQTTEIQSNIFKTMMGWAWDKLFRKDFIEEKGLLFQEQRTTNDLFFVFAALVSSKNISILDEVLIHYRKVSNGSLSATREKSWHCFYGALIALRNFLIKQNLHETYKIDFINYALHFSLWSLKTLSPPQQEILYNTLKETWFNNLEINSLAKNQIYNKNEYEDYKAIMNINYSKAKKTILSQKKLTNNAKKAWFFLQENGIFAIIKRLFSEFKKRIKRQA